jgi:hypothetical protein
MLVVGLLLIYGPASLIYTATSGRPHFLISWLVFGVFNVPHEIFSRIRSKITDFDAIVISMNFALALMYAGVIAGIELVNRLAPVRASHEAQALSSWRSDPLQGDSRIHYLLLATILALAMFMLYVSISEKHATVIAEFFSIKDNNERDLFRVSFGGSGSYAYRVILSALAPMFIIWGYLAALTQRSLGLFAATSLLLALALLGKIESLSKAPPAFFALQLMLAMLLLLTNRISLRLVVIGGAAVFGFLYLVTRLIMVFPEGMYPLLWVHTRLFEVSNQTVLEYFAAFPAIHPYLWGANIRPIAALMGVPYTPSFSAVADIWFGEPGITNPALFIADGWADFSYAGVIAYSILVGIVCRSTDLAFLVRGKSPVAIAVLGASVWGLLTLLTTALNIALLTGGLLLAPASAAMVMLSGRYLAARSLRTAQRQ